jgi:hypothetical protein
MHNEPDMLGQNNALWMLSIVDLAQILIQAIDPARVWAPKNGPASTSSILRHRRKAQPIRLLAG